MLNTIEKLQLEISNLQDKLNELLEERTQNNSPDIIIEQPTVFSKTQDDKNYNKFNVDYDYTFIYW